MSRWFVFNSGCHGVQFVSTLVRSFSVVCVLALSTWTQAADVVVVCGDEYRDALAPWCALRRAEGLTLAFCQPQQTTDGMSAAIQKTSSPDTKYVVLVGDAPSFGSQGGAGTVTGSGKLSRIPTFYLRSQVTAGYGSTPTYPTDLPYADFDRDGISDVIVGRLPVVTPEQLAGLVSRIVSYESSPDFGSWRRCLQLTAGVGGFGALVDGAIESVTRTVLTSVLPADAKPQIAYASPGHAFCPVGRSFGEAVIQRYRSGARFWVYAGHGSVDRLDFLTRSTEDANGLSQPTTKPSNGNPETGDQEWQVESLLNNETAAHLEGDPHRSPIAVLLACYAGAYDAPGDCLSERMLLAEGGPIAVIAASRLTMPYGNARFGLGLLESAYKPIGDETSPERLGDAMLAAIHRLQKNPAVGGAPQGTAAPVSTTQMMVDGLAGLISPAGSNLADERREHAGLYQLLGDPTLRLQRPQELTMTVESTESETDEQESAGRKVCVSVTSPIAGTLTVCVDRPLTAAPPIESGGDTNDRDDPHGCTLGQVSLPVDVSESGMAVIPLPESWNGPVVIRGFVQGVDAWATGATRLLLN
ncbi:C25 family cysteine peptidase [Aporhodopirellula aestuarii]|uniref:C25 family cysteine peptidase n=1 Tax=Aporhodopirellula aestuarii TaxID=2950107 RepID=A0ABT0U826_9BACT|nr:C25 family cysteine peptidase [Aporhodopirellula aestuarii]MCM2373079.1 C25 family cysteine peptidase [Aporhodopirellula aestuarii]